MERLRIRFYALTWVCVVLCSLSAVCFARVRHAQQVFSVYDALLFTNKPDLSGYGLRSDWIVYTQNMWPSNPDYNTPNEQYTRLVADEIVQSGYQGIVQLDIEHWPYDIRAQSTTTVDTSLAKLRQVLGWFKNEAPGLRVGYYAVLPIRDYWTPVLNDPTAMAQWRRANDYLKLLARRVDGFYPSLYTFYNDPTGWVTYARANIAEAKRLSGGKSVYAFIWPQYHNSSPLAGAYIDYDYWTLQLHTIQEAGADGIILWGGFQTPWDASQGWWQATVEFLSTLALPVSPLPSTPTRHGGGGR